MPVTPEEAKNLRNDKVDSSVSPPTLVLPKGGGAIRGIGEKFAANPVTGTGSMSIPVAVSPGRSGFGPQLNLSYDSGSGNSPFGVGWSLSIPSIARKTDKGLPQYRDAEYSDVFILSGAEDLVPQLVQSNGQWIRQSRAPQTLNGNTYEIYSYRPRIEGLFARIEHWINQTDKSDCFWRSISKDNITTWYGRTANSRIADPHDPTHIFSWLLCQSYDNKGNAIIYEYAEEDSAGIVSDWVQEANRNDTSRCTNRYLKRIRYGNRTPNRDSNWNPTDPSRMTDWMFEVVFDYGEGYYFEIPSNQQDQQFVLAHREIPPNNHWSVRQDPFSTYRAGFEVRTYRLCRRVLMFHHFPNELGIDDYLVRSTEFQYRESPIASFITSVTQSGYIRQPTEEKPNLYLKRSLPPVEFTYSRVLGANELAQQPLREIDVESLENLPIGLDGTGYQWMDLDGEGSSGILTEQADGWYYKHNLSANHQVDGNGNEYTVATFGATEIVAGKPAGGLSGGAQFLDLSGDGQVDLVQMEGPVKGFYERTTDSNWTSFQPFTSWPNLDMHDPNLKFVDLTGDGHTDILITQDDIFLWHPSLAEVGFGPAERIQQFWNEEKGPRLVFDDGTQSFYLADLSGDGLTDLVRIRNGEVCYWPNLGYGRFGAKVNMDNAPRFDTPDQFDQKRIRLADIDGSGTTDILYLRHDGVKIYFNQSGNSWSDAVALPQLPVIDNVAAVLALDLLGNGTVCLVWSSPLPGNARQCMRYLALMPEKPHLLVSVKNNLGVETVVHYAPSTRFYLDDKQAGTPWITRLPFPVHVVERVETRDLISRNRFVTRYAYHHGYFDGEEREFRGFGMVEQWDTEEIGSLMTAGSIANNDINWDVASYVPPTLTRTWFHTGAYIEGGYISKQFEHEYYREGDPSLGEGELTDAQLESILLLDTVLPNDLTVDETHEACRSLKGAILRQEIYAHDKKLDGGPTEKADRPYSVSERNYTIQRIQPRGDNKHAVFFTHPREQIDFQYERVLVQINGVNRADPRVNHAMTLAMDDYGNVLRALAIGYRRRDFLGLLPEQQETRMTLTANRVVNRPDESDWYRIGLPVESRTYEIVKPPESTISDTLVQLFKFDAMLALANDLFPMSQEEPDASKVWPYEKWDWHNNVSNAPDEIKLRLIEHVRTLYRKDDLTEFLPLGDIESLALPGESYRLAFTAELITQTFGVTRVTDAMLSSEGCYVHSEGDANWWMPSGKIFLSPNSNDSPLQELAFARAHFFLPHRYRNPFHTDTTSTETFVLFDSYNLLMQETRDALGNIVSAENDYRVLQPRQITDPNGNRAQAAFDVLGMVAGTAVLGKVTENLGDSLSGFTADLTQSEIDAFHDVPDPHALAPALLKEASTRIIYDLHRFYRSQQVHQDDPTKWEPPYAATLARETHAADPLPPQGLKIQISFSYSDGFGREIQKKVQAEPGMVAVEDVEGNITLVDTAPAPRWVGSGWAVFNNKGKPVCQYEPFFSAHPHFQFGKKIGVSSVLFYDPVGRVVATLHPNHSWEKVVFDPWQQKTYDVNDTVMLDPKSDADAGTFFSRLPEVDYEPTWYRQRVGGGMGAEEKRAAEKAAVHAGTPTVAHADSLGRTFLTIADNGAAGKYEMRLELDIEGNQRSVTDALGRTVMRYDYDMLGTKIHSVSMDAGERWMLNDVSGKPIYAWDSRGFVRHMTYDALRRPLDLLVTENGVERLAERTIYGETQGDANNHRTRVYKIYDGAEIVTSNQFDFKGNLLNSTRQLLQNYKSEVDWKQLPPLESKTFASSTTYDALNRLVALTTPDNSVIHPTYNEANLLEQLHLKLRGSPSETPFVTNIDYNAKGQRQLIEYGNGASTNYEYDEATFRLKYLLTTRASDNRHLQELSYTYDPVGNITSIRDDAQQTIFFNNQVVTASAEYFYDALYRLISADGREHIGQNSNAQVDHDDSPRMNQPLPTDGQAMRNYCEAYEYDAVGNILKMIHQAANGNWTRRYQYAEDSNHLLSTSLPGDPDAGRYSAKYEYDVHGNMVQMPHLPVMEWEFKDQLHVTGQQTVNNGIGERTYYVYDSSGQRTRKVTERANGSRKEECIYLGGFEIYREYNGATGATELERETLHIMDDKQRIALLETRTQGDDGSPAQLVRYQFSNHLGSASLELDESAAVITYEEYYPYGSTSYQAVQSQTQMPKRYRYTGKERDEESGLYYYGARYYASWLGRWTSCDPVGVIDSLNLYYYVSGNPIRLVDPRGKQGTDNVDSSGISKANFLPVPMPHPTPTPGPGIDTAIDRGFMTRGGGNLLAGGGMMAAGGLGLYLLSQVTPVGWAADIVLAVGITSSSLMFVGGTSSTIVGGIQLATPLTAAQDAQLNTDMQTTRTMFSSTGNFVFFPAGVAYTGTLEGGSRWAEYGGKAEAVADLSYNIGNVIVDQREFANLYKGSRYRWGGFPGDVEDVRPANRIALGRGARASSRPNSLFPRGIEFEELSHWIPQRFMKALGLEEFGNQPWNLVPRWGTEHALSDPYRFKIMTKAFKDAYEGEQLTGFGKFVYRTPPWALGVTRDLTNKTVTEVNKGISAEKKSVIIQRDQNRNNN